MNCQESIHINIIQTEYLRFINQFKRFWNKTKIQKKQHFDILTRIYFLLYANFMKELHKYSNSIKIRGIIAIIFGVIAFISPMFGLEILILFFGAFALLDGIVAFFVGFPTKSTALTVEGIVGVLVGLFVFFYTDQATLIFLTIVGIWAVITGALEIIAAVELRKHMKNEVWLLLIGVASVIFGVLMFKNPEAIASILMIIIGVYAVVFGIFLLALAKAVNNLRPAKAKVAKKSSKKKARK